MQKSKPCDFIFVNNTIIMKELEAKSRDKILLTVIKRLSNGDEEMDEI